MQGRAVAFCQLPGHDRHIPHRHHMLTGRRMAESEQIRMRPCSDEVQVVPIDLVDQQPIRLDVASASNRR